MLIVIKCNNIINIIFHHNKNKLQNINIHISEIVNDLGVTTEYDFLLREGTPEKEIIWEGKAENPQSSFYRAYKIPSIHPDAFSVKADNFILNDNDNIIKVIDNQIHFTIYNHSGYMQDYSYNFTDLNNEIFNNEQGDFTLNPNESIILSFNANNSEIDITQIMLIVTPVYHDYAEKQLVFNVSNLNLSNNIFISDFKLTNIYPNPFNPSTTISYDVSNLSNVKISIYNINGQLVEILKDQLHKAGQYNITWNANEYTSGVYFVKLMAGNFVDRQKIILIK